MINELKVMQQMVEVIGSHLNEYLDEELPVISDKQVLLEFPDVDKMPFPVMFYVQPDYAAYEEETTCSDKTDFRISVFIMCKRDTKANLTLKTYGYYNALYELLKTNYTLYGAIAGTQIIETHFYPAIEANANVQGVELSVSTEFTKDF